MKIPFVDLERFPTAEELRLHQESERKIKFEEILRVILDQMQEDTQKRELSFNCARPHSWHSYIKELKEFFVNKEFQVGEVVNEFKEVCGFWLKW